MHSRIEQRSAGIDLLRCFSILLVIGSHYGILGGFPLSGTHGVAIFFMVSGFCMTYSMESRTGAQFLVARFWRLVPTLVVCSTITQLIESILPQIRADRLQSVGSYLGNLACLPNGNFLCDIIYDLIRGHAFSYSWVDGAYWSLLVEIRFYILLWIVYYLLKVRHPIFLIASLGLISLFQFDWQKISKGTDFFMYMPFFAFGMAHRKFSQNKTESITLMIYSFFVFLIAAFVGVSSISMTLSRANCLTYTSCFVIYLACMTVYRQSENKWVSYFGVISYPLYLLHQDIGLIFLELFKKTPPSINVSLVFFIVVAFAATVNTFLDCYQPKLKSYLSQLVLRKTS